MKTKSKLLVMASLICGSFFQSSITFAEMKGGIGGGGGYKYTYTSNFQINDILTKAQDKLLNVPDQKLEELSSKFKTIIDWTLFKNIIKNIELKPNENSIRNNQKLALNYDLNNMKIIAYEPFFDFLDKSELSESDTKTAIRMIYHEVSHLFFIGITDDYESIKFSSELLSLVELNKFNCGAKNNLEDSLESCKKTNLEKIDDYILNGNKSSKLFSLLSIFLRHGALSKYNTETIQFDLIYKNKSDYIIRNSTSGQLLSSINSDKLVKKDFKQAKGCESLPKEFLELGTWRLPTYSEAQQMIESEGTFKKYFINRHDSQECIWSYDNELKTVCSKKEIKSWRKSIWTLFQSNAFYAKLLCVLDLKN